MRYRLTDKIGSGGMAEVFRAVGIGPEGFERPFVIKRIHPHLSEAPEFVRMFVDEAKISARLIHPNIVQVFEFAHHDGSYYIVMEPVEGMDMAWFRRRKPERRNEFLPTTFVAEVGRQVCRGLDFAHTLKDADGKPLGIVHRDVTPPNIMVAWNGTVKILDFGLARAAEAVRSNHSDAGMVKGKMPYLAPELLEGATADGRSDVFSLGAVLHELLTGEQLFAGENDLDTLKRVKEMPLLPPSAWNPGVKPALDSVVMRALERDPGKRYRTAAQMGDELEALVLRKSYSTRALARKARELAAQEKPDEPEKPAGAGARPAGTVEAEIDQPGSSFVLDKGERRAAPRPSPPPLPAGAVPAGVGARAPWPPSRSGRSCVGRSPSRSRTCLSWRPPRRRRWRSPSTRCRRAPP
jgi:serine/threonine protein kinase